MWKYRISVTEIAEYQLEIVAKNKKEAAAKAIELWRNTPNRAVEFDGLEMDITTRVVDRAKVDNDW